MSDTQQGPDWWMASDGKWYPPETAPGTTAASGTTSDDQPGFAAPDASAGFSGGTNFGTPPPPGSTIGAAPGQYAPPAYGAPPPSAPTNSGATTSLILGIVALLLCGLITGIPAIIIGNRARREIRESNGQQGGDGMALAGIITGVIGTIWSAITIIAFVGILILGASVDPDDEIRFDDDLGEINSDPSDGDCDRSRFLQDPDC